MADLSSIRDRLSSLGAKAAKAVTSYVWGPVKEEPAATRIEVVGAKNKLNCGEISSSYFIEIYCRAMGIHVIALMQKVPAISTSSQWSPVPGLSFLGDKLDDFIQIIYGKSTIQPFMSRRSWNGSSPLSISVELKFEAIDDAYNEVEKPCIFLQKLSLPSVAASSIRRDAQNSPHPIYLLNPPGPNPYGYIARHDENIIVNIGNLIEFESVIIKEVVVNYENKFTAEGHPISAAVNVVFETFEMLTANQLEESYRRGKTSTPMRIASIEKLVL